MRDDGIPRRGAVEFLILLLCGDVLFIALHFLHTSTPYLSDPGFAIDKERGFGEVFQYVKEYWIVLLCCWLSARRSEPSYLAWAVVFGYLLLDDSAQLHEWLGVRLARHFALPDVMALRGRDLGELAVSAVAGVVLLSVVGVAWRRGSSRFRRSSRRLAQLLGLLAFAGVVVDMVHVMVGESAVSPSLAVLEDGGELLVMSAICWFVFQLLEAERRPSTPPHWPEVRLGGVGAGSRLAHSGQQ